MKLFAILVGGEVKGANIEVNDLRFVVAPTIADAYDELRRQWWGIPRSLHIDGWAEISHAEGYDVNLRPEPFSGPERLYYVNLGGYDPTEFAELHKHVFVVATSALKAKSRALKSVRDWRGLHCDNIHELDQARSLVGNAGQPRLVLHLTASAMLQPIVFSCSYAPIGSKR